MSLKSRTIERANIIQFCPTFLLIVTVLLITACGSADPVDTPEPISAQISEESAPVAPTEEPAPVPTVEKPAAVQTTMEPTPVPIIAEPYQPISGGPVLLRGDISLRKVVDVGGANIRLVRDPVDDALYYLYKDGKISKEEALKNADSRNDLEGKISFG